MRALWCLALLSACEARHEPQPRREVAKPAAIARDDLNRFAVRLNLPIYWIDDNQTADLLFYPTPKIGKDDAIAKIRAAIAAPPEKDPRIALVEKDLDQGRPTLVRTDLKDASPAERAFVGKMLQIAAGIDQIYAVQDGSAALADKVPADPASQSLFRRNRGPKCVGPATEKDPACSAIPGAPKPIVDVYPAALQTSDAFCKDLEARPEAKQLLEPFTAVREQGGKLVAVPFAEAYKPQMSAIATELEQAADAMKDSGEAALIAYLRAAASAFRTNNWLPADEAWAQMNVDNSKWYVRVGPDEVYWEPCAHKAGFHLTFAKIDQASKAWQQKLVPVQQQMEDAVAARAGAPYASRKVTFHLPDFIDIVFNAGDDRSPLGATVGQSLPNWGPVANEGRGRTVAMVNFYGDPDSLASRRAQAESLLDAASMQQYASSQEPGLLVTILHEATHNLGPAHEYKVGGKTDGEIFGGPIASVFEELKAQTGGIFLIEFLRAKGLISDELARNAYTDAIVWAFGQISQGMYTGTKSRKTYGNVAAIQIGFLLEHGALTWDGNAPAANGKDKGAFTIHVDKLVGAADEMMKLVGGIKARGDKAGADALLAKYVDSSTVVPHQIISERFLRFPKASFVYSVTGQ